MRINHIGVIVKDINKNISIYFNMGYYLQGPIKYDHIQCNQVAFMVSNFSPNIELIEPTDERSSIYNFKFGYHHICYEAELGEDIIKNFKSMRIGKIFTKPIIAPALDNREVVFACLQNGTFVEFIL